MLRILIAVFLISLLFDRTIVVEAAQNATEDQLISLLLLNYNKYARPDIGNTNVTVDVLVSNIDEMDEKQEVVHATVQLTIMWKDQRFQWNPNDWSGVDSLSLPANVIWVPDVALVNSAGDLYNSIFYSSYYLVEIDSDGFMGWYPYGQVAAKCDMDLLYFPFDSQMCYFHYQSRVYRSNTLTLVPTNFTQSAVNDSGEWKTVKASSLGTFSSTNPAKSHSSAYYCFTLKRKILFFMLRYIFPTACLSALVSLVYILPAESQEKVTLDITALLSFVVLYVDVSGFLPNTSDYSPLLSKYLGFVTVMAGVSLLCTTIVMCVTHTKHTSVPGWIQRVFVNKLGRWLRVIHHKVQPESRSNSAGLVPPRSNSAVKKNMKATRDMTVHSICDADEGPAAKVDPVIDEILTTIEAIKQELLEERRGAEIAHTWAIVGRVIDRLIFIVYSMLTILASLVILAIVPKSSDISASCSPCDCYKGYVI